MADEQRWNIGDLVRETGLSRRTIHFYLHQGLLPSPEGSGRRAYYLEHHLLRLQLISLLREAGLKLDSIGTCLAGLRVGEMRRLVRRAEEISLEDPRQLARWLHRGCADEDPFLVRTDDGVAADEAETTAPPGAGDRGAAAPDAGPGPWQRRQLRQGVELHFRSDLDGEVRDEVRRLIRIAETLLGDND